MKLLGCFQGEVSVVMSSVFTSVVMSSVFTRVICSRPDVPL